MNDTDKFFTFLVVVVLALVILSAGLKIGTEWSVNRACHSAGWDDGRYEIESDLEDDERIVCINYTERLLKDIVKEGGGG